MSSLTIAWMTGGLKMELGDLPFAYWPRGHLTRQDGFLARLARVWKEAQSFDLILANEVAGNAGAGRSGY